MKDHCFYRICECCLCVLHHLADIKLYLDTYQKANLHEESIKYDLLEAMKNEKIPGPFTTEKEIRDYLELAQDEKIRNSHLYNEI